MESNLILNAETRNIMVTNVPSGTAEVTTQSNGTLSIVGGVSGYMQGAVEVHNLDKYAHKNLWYVHEQGTASDTWLIQHNLDRNPSVTVVDTADTVVTGCVTYIDKNTILISFNGAFKGKAYLN